MNTATIGSVLWYGGAVLASFALVRQCRKPSWLPGQLFARIMNSTHSAMTRWALGHLTLARDSVILDVGCGGGRTIQQLALLSPEGKVSGIDYSAASVSVARRTNAHTISAGRVDISVGSVSSMPYADDSFDVVTAVETHYYWPDLVTDLGEVRRVLRPAGRIMIVAESYRGKRFGAAEVLVMRVLGSKLLTIDEHRAALEAAAFRDVAVFEEKRKGWLCVLGVRSPEAEGVTNHVGQSRPPFATR
jgi:ubiquinone/menaquinone biosynthesis C-methylase UbiE